MVFHGKVTLLQVKNFYSADIYMEFGKLRKDKKERFSAIV